VLSSVTVWILIVIPEATGILQSIDASLAGNNQTAFFNRATQLKQNGFYGGTILDLTTTLIAGPNSAVNINPAPKTVVYPKAGASDAPYNVLEISLRGAIYIPSTFTYGKKPPVILFPGTGATGYTSFAGNFIKTLTNVNYADPVWVNVPGFLDGDAQVNAVNTPSLHSLTQTKANIPRNTPPTLSIILHP
jgi:hypothetical protein